MNWKVEFTRKVVKQISKLPLTVKAALLLLVDDLARLGPAPGKGWPNYSKLKGIKSHDKRHCHLIKGKPTYVCCWEVVDKQVKIIEVYYVGTHEKAPY
jgi:mRNA-degrading endonuclease RelE of RelBE toxin-antitoxin system